MKYSTKFKIHMFVNSSGVIINPSKSRTNIQKSKSKSYAAFTKISYALKLGVKSTYLLIFMLINVTRSEKLESQLNI